MATLASQSSSAVPIKATSSLRNTTLFRLIEPFKKELLLLVAVSSVANLLMLLPTIYMLQIFDRVMISQSVLTLAIVSLIVVALYGVQAFSEWLRTRIIVAMGIRLDMTINAPLFHAVFQDRLATSSRNSTQALSDLTTIRQWITSNGLNAFLDAPWSPFYVVIMFMLHPILGWATLLFMGILLVFAFFALYKTRDISEASIEEERELNAFIFHKLRNAEVIEAHGMVPNLMQRWWTRQVELNTLQHHSSDIEARLTSSSKELKYGMNSFALGIGALLAIYGEITMGAMIAASLLMARATAPIDALVFGWKGLLTSKSAFQRLEQLLSDHSPSWVDRSAALKLPQSFDLALKDITVELERPSGPMVPILKRLTLQIPDGQCTVVLGDSGAGKSTLAKLLVGILEPTQGELSLGGVPLSRLNRNALGSKIGYLPQDVELFAESMASNIARLSEPDTNKVIAAAQAVGIHEFILSLPRGYDTVVGDVGGFLSGGQRQRLALARAVYDNPPLLVLDEPNASLDEAGESALASVITALKQKGSTIVLISHRPNVLRLADQVVVLSAGELSFAGPANTYPGRPSEPVSSNDE